MASKGRMSASELRRAQPHARRESVAHPHRASPSVAVMRPAGVCRLQRVLTRARVAPE
jgi:hypothetical protein